VTTGAASDIEHATDLARRMVTKFGMSDKIGAIAVGDREQEIFLGRELSQRREISERTSELVDEEVKRIIDGAYQRARDILAGKRGVLDALAAALLERETLERDDVMAVVAGQPLPPRREPPLIGTPVEAAPAAAKGTAPAPLGVPKEAPSPA
jgi:cell division protease FtsH